MKTKEELNVLKNEVAALNQKLTELNEDELAQVIGGISDYKTRKAPLEPWDLIFKNQAVGDGFDLHGEKVKRPDSDCHDQDTINW